MYVCTCVYTTFRRYVCIRLCMDGVWVPCACAVYVYVYIIMYVLLCVVLCVVLLTVCCVGGGCVLCVVYNITKLTCPPHCLR